MTVNANDILKDITYEDGILRQMGKRIVIVPFAWLINLQKEIENILGSDGAYVLIKNASYKAGIGVANEINAFLKSKSLEEKIQFYLNIVNTAGWGKVTLVKINKDPLEVVLKYEHSYVEGHYQNESEGKCYYISSVSAVIEEFMKFEGINYPLEAIETKCVAKGDPYCEFIIKKA